MFGVIGEDPSCRHDFLVLEEGSVTGSFDGAVRADKVVVKDVAWSFTFGNLLSCRSISPAGPQFVAVHESAIYRLGNLWHFVNLSFIFEESTITSEVVLSNGLCFIVLVVQ
jgi:hypothetical protein